MKLIEGFSAILPGDKDLGYIPFNKNMFSTLEKDSFLFIWAKRNFKLFIIDNQDSGSNHFELMQNFLIFLKQNDSEKFKKFRFEFLDVYLKSNEHTGELIASPYDPANVIMSIDNEFDLLKPVLERGQIWR